MKTVFTIASVVLLFLVSCKPPTHKDHTAITQVTNNSTGNAVVLANASLETTPTISNLYITASSGLSLREGTNLKSQKILTIPYGSQVKHLSSPEHTTMTVAGITGDMIQVNYQGATGFVFSGYLSTLSPPLEDESATQYAKRLSTPTEKINVSKIKNAKGDEFGLTTTIELPAKSWGEAYMLAQSLFDIPKNIVVDLTDNTISKRVNAKKRVKTKTDEVTIGRDKDFNINHITYSYALRDYSRTVTVTQHGQLYLIAEAEISK